MHRPREAAELGAGAQLLLGAGVDLARQLRIRGGEALGQLQQLVLVLHRGQALAVALGGARGLAEQLLQAVAEVDPLLVRHAELFRLLHQLPHLGLVAAAVAVAARQAHELLGELAVDLGLVELRAHLGRVAAERMQHAGQRHRVLDLDAQAVDLFRQLLRVVAVGGLRQRLQRERGEPGRGVAGGGLLG